LRFNVNGYLEPGIHDLDHSALEEHFVTAFPHSSTRSAIIAGFGRHSNELMQLGIPCVEFLDGSFVSNKADPGDIDMVGFMDLDAVDALDNDQQNTLTALFAGKATRASHLCDAYFVPSVPDHHPLFDKLRAQRKYWMGEFGYDREDRPKGIVRLQVTPKLATDEDAANA
jgi:hypothetical protein